jgi:DNA-binding response OmpR family regulator
MDHEHALTFGPFRLDVAHSRVWQGDQVTALRPRTVAMLRYLVEHPRRLVTKSELRQHVWGGDARQRHRPAGVCAGDSGGVGRLGDSAELPRNG